MSSNEQRTRQTQLGAFFGKRKADGKVNDGELARKKETREEGPKENRRLSMHPVINMSGDKKEEARYPWLVEIRDKNKRRPCDEEYDGRTLYIPPSQWELFTPFERQYWEIKSMNYDRVVFFKKGKFYELYEGDADLGASLFDLKVTPRINMRMAGVPVASFSQWAERFIARGHSVARVDQAESGIEKNVRERDGGKKETLIRRELSDVLTAGTLIDGIFDKERSYCMAVKFSDDGTSSVCFVDASVAAFYFCFFQDDGRGTILGTLLGQIRPKEILYEKGVSEAKRKLLKREGCSLIPLCPYKEFPSHAQTINELERYEYFDKNEDRERLNVLFEGKDDLGSCFGALMGYLRSLRLDRRLIPHGRFMPYSPLEHGQSLLLDGQTLSNLCVLEGDEDNKGSLLGALDHCRTLFGRRMLKEWVCHPLRCASRIGERQDAIRWIYMRSETANEVRRRLSEMGDIERAVGRCSMGVCKVKDFVRLLGSLQSGCLAMRRLADDVCEAEAKRLVELVSKFPDIGVCVKQFQDCFEISEESGRIIPKSGADKENDRIEMEIHSVQKWLDDYLSVMRQRFACKMEYKTIGKEGFQLEVPEGVVLPQDFFLLSRRDGWRRYWTPELKQSAEKHRELKELQLGIVETFFLRLQSEFSANKEEWRTAVSVLGEIDCLCSLATFALFLGEEKCLPSLVEDKRAFLSSKSLRYPSMMLSEAARHQACFIPNDVCIGREERLVLLTGPNMGGKSTLLRQTCLCIILAQLGSFVPALECTMTPFDRIFTRIGANDNIISGHSTFMVELSETARILCEATEKSFVVIDELGRGTSTFDGMSIAYTVLGHLVTGIGCAGLFATHYKSLAEEYASNKEIRPMHMACLVDKEKRDIVFLYKMIEGVAEKSYGTNVAMLAGVDKSIVSEAEEISDAFEREVSKDGKKKALFRDIHKILSFLEG
eukprot:GHVN01098728.1.p1 GENE.GHVN01098728.1~~GHVN01098728.1.p1  ORF type:complete len:944 (+),score=103.91 GHVN01098728.1:3054-5885(+)